jgi:hypothetical protein
LAGKKASLFINKTEQNGSLQVWTLFRLVRCLGDVPLGPQPVAATRLAVGQTQSTGAKDSAVQEHEREVS